jgi:alkylation response protein AidB-like acyl-CoA dehydrogenase
VEPSRFDLSEEQLRLLEEARALARETLARIAARGTPGRVNRELVRALAETGVLPRLFPERAGGAAEHDVFAMDLCLLREGLAQGSVDAETALAMQGLGAYPLVQSATPELVDRWVPRIASGEAIGAFALTEPEHGTDAAAIELSAERDGGGWRLSGTKTWISNAPDADMYVLFARTDPDAGARGITALVLPGDAAGLSGEPIDLLATHPIGRLELDGVRLSSGDVVGEVGAGFKVAMRTLDLFRPSVGAFAVGMAQAALTLAASRARHRSSMGKALREHQAVSQTLAEMATRTEAARLLVYAAASAHDRGQRTTSRSAMAKLFATETAQWVVDAAVQIHGASGLERGHPLEHLYRDVRAPRIYEGTSEIQREIISRELYR